jgi:hypothetical protein
MTKRNGKKPRDLGSQPVEAGEAAAAAVATDPTPADPPSIEERVAKLEELLGEKDRLILRQANALAIGVENAERLRKSRERVQRAEDRADDAKKAASEAKKAYETAVSDHFELEQELDSPQQRLPFTAELGDGAAPESGGSSGTSSTPTASGAPGGGDGDQPWRRVILDTLELSRATVEKLHEANLTTVGELCDYLQPAPSGFCKSLTDIPGIGASKAAAIEEALDTFWEGQASPVSFPTADANAEILAGVEEVEAALTEEDEDSGDDDNDDRDVPMSEDEVASWRRVAGSV